MNHSFSEAICCSAADGESNGSSTNSDHDFTSCTDFEVKDSKKSINRNNSSSKETECIMESKLARKLVMVLAIFTGFAFVGFGEAKAAEFNRAEFQSSAFNTVACCRPDFKQTAFTTLRFGQLNHGKAFRTFSFTNHDFGKAATEAFGSDVRRGGDFVADFIPSGEFTVAFAPGFQNVFSADFLKTTGFGREAFHRDLFESATFPRSTFEKDGASVNFDSAQIDNRLASVRCCRSIGFTRNTFPEFDGQFQTQA
jgi:hypothetical protein